MPVRSCNICWSVDIVTGEPATDECPKMHCDGTMERFYDPHDAKRVLSRASVMVDVVAEKQAAEKQAAQAEIRRLSAIRRAAR